MSSDGFVVLDSFDNRVKHVLPDAQFRFEQSHELFAVVRINPHTVLQAYEADFSHDASESVPYVTTSLRNIENDHAPALVPAALHALELHLLPFECKFVLSRFGNLQIYLVILLY